MATLKDLKQRQGLVKKISRMTSAIKMASQAKMGRARAEHQKNQQFLDHVESLLHRMQKEWHQSPKKNPLCSPLLNSKKVHHAPHILIVASSDRGLCGNFNTAIQKRAEGFLKDMHSSEHAPIHVLCAGRVHIKKHPQSSIYPLETFSDLCCRISALSQSLIHAFVHGHIGGAHIVTQKFLNILNQEPHITQILPLSLPPHDPKQHYSGLLSYEPCPQFLFQETIETYFASFLSCLIKEHTLSEHSARFLAMDGASENAKKMQEDLSIQYNRQRQSKITTEILELSAASCV